MSIIGWMYSKFRKENEVINAIDTKEFLYIDNDHIDSFLAQLDKDASQIEVRKQQKRDTQGSGKDLAIALDGEMDDKSLIVLEKKGRASISGTYRSPQKNKEEALETVKIRKQKDRDFKVFLAELKRNNMIKTRVGDEELLIGQYTELKSQFDFIDFDRIESLFSDEFWELYNNLPIGMEGNIFNQDAKKEIEINMHFLKTMLPYYAMLCSDDVLVVLDKDILRADKSHIGFKFGGNVSVIGRVSKIIHSDSASGSNINRAQLSSSNVVQQLNQIQNIALSLMKELGFISDLNAETIYIVTPIAIYFNNVILQASTGNNEQRLMEEERAIVNQRIMEGENMVDDE